MYVKLLTHCLIFIHMNILDELFVDVHYNNLVKKPIIYDNQVTSYK